MITFRRNGHTRHLKLDDDRSGIVAVFASRFFDCECSNFHCDFVKICRDVGVYILLVEENPLFLSFGMILSYRK